MSASIVLLVRIGVRCACAAIAVPALLMSSIVGRRCASLMTLPAPPRAMPRLHDSKGECEADQRPSGRKDEKRWPGRAQGEHPSSQERRENRKACQCVRAADVHVRREGGANSMT